MTVIDEYLIGIDNPQKKELKKIRRIVKEIAPDAKEVIIYGIPGFKYKGKYLVGFNSFKDHLSLFPTSEPVEVLKDKLKGFKLSKGTIQFKLDNPIPEQLIKDLISIRIQSITKSN